MRKKGDNPMVLYHLGLAQEGLGESRIAVGLFEQALRLRRKFPEAEQALLRARSTNPVAKLWRRLSAKA
jgi:hypothetical protein